MFVSVSFKLLFKTSTYQHKPVHFSGIVSIILTHVSFRTSSTKQYLFLWLILNDHIDVHKAENNVNTDKRKIRKQAIRVMFKR